MLLARFIQRKHTLRTIHTIHIQHSTLHHTSHQRLNGGASLQVLPDVHRVLVEAAAQLLVEELVVTVDAVHPRRVRRVSVSPSRLLSTLLLALLHVPRQTVQPDHRHTTTAIAIAGAAGLTVVVVVVGSVVQQVH
jgi:hypothetical protein